MSPVRRYCPALVIGAGLAGCTAALVLANRGIDITLLAAGPDYDDGNSWKAQGGIIFRSTDKEDAKALMNDILVAGHHYNNVEAVRYLCEEGPLAVEEILVEQLGIPFDRLSSNDPRLKASEWDLTKEGGHSALRILHCADHTGQSIMDYILAAVQKHPNITYLSGYTAIDLLTSHHNTHGMTYRYTLQNECCGAYVYNEHRGRVETFLADKTVLATGGVGQLYLHSTNVSSAVGSGIAMASRAFVRLENMEFMQFHPTTFYDKDKPRFLITEAMRGEGAVLINSKGERFMTAVDSRAELAPRDIVARGIVEELLKSGDSCVFLDATGVPHKDERFPTVLENCLERGIDIRKEPIPVVPAAHYFCGGILVDKAGRTSLENLYAAGECTCTGVHGANRLASTSLLEALLWGKSAAEDIADSFEQNKIDNAKLFESIRDWVPLGSEHNDDPALVAQDWATIRNTMWNYVGITRTEARLVRAFSELRDLSRHVHTFYRSTPISKPLIDLFHACQTAYLITQAALRNHTSIGCHYRAD